MLFSSSLFVFKFLPIVLVLYYGLRFGMRNTVLLCASLLFYAWGEKLMTAVMLLSIVGNYAFGLWVARSKLRGGGKAALVWAIVFNVGILIAFKYADWLWSVFNFVIVGLGIVDSPFPEIGRFIPPDSPWRVVLLTGEGHIRLPIGVSFFTFQATSYVIDIYRGDVDAEKSLLDFGMYKSFFPQLIAGPIVRYRDVHVQIHSRQTTVEGFAYGIRRFVIGLGKKMLIANVVAKVADDIFAIPGEDLTTPLAWLGIVAYSLQIYFDFSGYSDMAIGLGHMFGFKFLENFNYPYVARSITDFWRRWHISLSTWFRDYLYIPLGGNRVRPARTYLNLLTVFFLCGLWHGASFNFVVWGLFHGSFLVLERVGFGKFLEQRSALLRHAYTLLVVMIGWVFFRASDLPHALDFLATMFGVSSSLGVGRPDVYHLDLYVSSLVATALVAGFVGSMPWLSRVTAWHAKLAERGQRALGTGLEVAALVLLAVVFVSSALELSAGTYNPFIYFRF